MIEVGEAQPLPRDVLPIVDFVIAAPPGAQALIVEPPATAEFRAMPFTDNAIRQAISEAVRIQPRGAAVLSLTAGRGAFVVDQIRWDAAIRRYPQASAIPWALLGNLGARFGE